MSTVNSINTIDGNQYLLNASVNQVDSDSNESFDEVLNGKSKTLEDIFQQVSEEYEVPVKLLKAVAQAESSFDTNAVSGCGASGIMQLMPQTAKSLGVEDVFDAEQNITGGAKMLAYLLDDYDGNTTLALAAYNAGSGAVAKYGGVPPYDETQNYIKKINSILGGELEVDTSDISITKSSSNASGDNVTKLPESTNYSNTTISTTQSKAQELFSYDDYLKFLDMYQNTLSKLFNSEDYEESDDSNKTDSSQSAQNSQSEQQSLYEIQQAMYNPLAISLLDL